MGNHRWPKKDKYPQHSLSILETLFSSSTQLQKYYSVLAVAASKSDTICDCVGLLIGILGCVISEGEITEHFCHTYDNACVASSTSCSFSCNPGGSTAHGHSQHACVPPSSHVKARTASRWLRVFERVSLKSHMNGHNLSASSSSEDAHLPSRRSRLPFSQGISPFTAKIEIVIWKIRNASMVTSFLPREKWFAVFNACLVD